jgi:AraC family transcriptional regulator of adaptative response/methylated-DNA-[protein]-cysteine methyltransferase
MNHYLTQSALDYQRVEKAILFLEKNFQKQPQLSDVARHVHLSEFHFQRLFKRWAGISPKKFLQFLTVEYAKTLLERSQNLLDVTYESGLSSSGRLHDLFVNIEAVTPGEYKSRGEGLIIHYGFHPTPFGDCFIAITEKGICALAFVDKKGRQADVERLRQSWLAATLVQSEKATRQYVETIFSRQNNREKNLTLFLKGTNFQVKVWEALLRIPSARMVSYEDIARMVCSPRATRAVANAVANNPIAYLIPCHRVIRKTGVFGKYQWGSSRKKALLAWEASRA